MDLEGDLTGSEGPGRHPLPPPADFMRTLGRHGIIPQTAVVAYDDRTGAVASRLWWMLRDLGHRRVAVLDGGIAACPPPLLDSEPVAITPNTYEATPGHMPRIERDNLLAGLGDSILIDARAAERYRGETEPIDPVAGHIPTARSAPLTGNVDEHGFFLTPTDLERRFKDLGVDQADGVVSYCGSGVTACHNILAMEVAGLPTAKLYPGSWSDWSTAGMPTSVGSAPGEWPV